MEVEFSYKMHHNRRWQCLSTNCDLKSQSIDLLVRSMQTVFGGPLLCSTKEYKPNLKLIAPYFFLNLPPSPFEGRNQCGELFIWDTQSLLFISLILMHDY